MSNTPVVPTPHGGPETYLGKVHDIQFNRDCVHVACFQVEIEEVWNVSNACMLKINSEGKAVPTENREQALGILDPFILDPSILNRGDKVWLILFPGMIRSLSHYWEHDAFPPAPVEKSLLEYQQEKEQKILSSISPLKLESFQYLDRIANDLEITLDRLLQEASYRVKDDSYYYVGNYEAEGYSLGSDFWKHYQIYTEIVVLPENQGNFISCSC